MKIVRLILLLVIVAGVGGGGYAGYKYFTTKKTEFYYLDIVNTGKTRAEVQVTMCNETLVVESESSKVFKVEKQEPAQKDILREFTIKTGGKIQTVKANVAYNEHTIVDVTGDSCIVVADYGLQYRQDSLKLPEGTKTIKILKVYDKHDQVFPAAPFDRQSGKNEFQIDLGLGEPLPEKRKGKGQYVKTVRMLVVPRAVVGNDKALYDWVGKN